MCDDIIEMLSKIILVIDKKFIKKESIIIFSKQKSFPKITYYFFPTKQLYNNNELIQR